MERYREMITIHKLRRKASDKSFPQGHHRRKQFCWHLDLVLQDSKTVKVLHSCPTLCYPMDYTVHGILQASILEQVALSFSRGSSQPRDRTQVSHKGSHKPGVCSLSLLQRSSQPSNPTRVSCTAGWFLTNWAVREAQHCKTINLCCLNHLSCGALLWLPKQTNTLTKGRRVQEVWDAKGTDCKTVGNGEVH